MKISEILITMCQKMLNLFILKKRYKENTLNGVAKYRERHQFPGQKLDEQHEFGPLQYCTDFKGIRKH